MFTTNSKTYLVLGVALIVGITVGYLFGSSGKNQAYQLGLEGGRAEIEEKYQKKIEEIFPSVPEPAEVFSVSGRITKIEDRVLTLEVMLPVFNPFEEPKVETRLVKLTDMTEFAKQVLKSPEELAKEEEAFAAGETELPPSPYDEGEIDFSELKIGDIVAVEAEENIKGKSTFEAKRIILSSF